MQKHSRLQAVYSRLLKAGPWIAISFLLQTGCGSDVEVGANRDQAIKQASEDGTGTSPGVGGSDTSAGQTGGNNSTGDNGSNTAGQGSQGSNTGGAGSGDGGGTGGDGSGGGSAACYGAAAEVPEQFNDFCSVGGEHATQFAESIDMICNNKMYINLLQPSCAYQGGQLTNFKIELADDHPDNANWLKFYAVSSTLIQGSVDDYLELVRDELRDPDGFAAAGYKTISTATLSENEEVNEDEFNYFVNVTALRETYFRTNVQIHKVSDDFAVIYDYAYADKKTIIENRFLQFIQSNGDGTATLVGIDDKVVDDLGKHKISTNSSYQVLTERMTKAYENSRK